MAYEFVFVAAHALRLAQKGRKSQHLSRPGSTIAGDMNLSLSTKLTLVLGPANSGKMGVVLDWWRERLSERPLLVAPTVPDAGELTREMGRRAGGLVGQSPAVTLDGLVRLVLKRSPRYATDFERALIAARLLRDTPLDALESSAQLPGVSTALAALLDQFADSGRTPETVDRVLDRWASVSPEASALSGDLRRLIVTQAQIYAALGLSDRPSAAREAVSSLKDWTRPVAFYGFTSFTPVQRALVEELSRGVEVLVVFTHDRSRPVNLATSAEISWWEARAAKVIEVTTPARAYNSPAIAYLERHFMSVGPRPEAPPAFECGRGVRFLLSAGRRIEAELAAEQIAGLFRSGLRPREIGVVVRHIRQWSRLLGQVFSSCGIPYSVDDRCMLRETGLGYAFLCALRGVALDDAESLLAYLRSPYSGISSEAVADLELAYRRGFSRGAHALACLATTMGIGSIAGIWAMVGAGDKQVAVASGVAPRFDPAEAAGWAERMLMAGLRDAVPGDGMIEEDICAFRTLRAAFESMMSLTSGDGRDGSGRDGDGRDGDGCNGAKPASGETEWLDVGLVLRSLDRAAVPAGRLDSGDTVQIVSVQRARARRFEAVIVLGLVEGEFPGRPETPSLLTRPQRMQIDQLSGGLLPAEVNQEAALFASAISRPWRLLLLSARDAEDDGSESMPSHYWHAAKDLLGAGLSDHIGRTLADQVFSPQDAPSFRHYLRGCAALGHTPHPSISPSGDWAALSIAERTPCRLTNPAVLAELRGAEYFSPSALETYADCPFRWFVERVIAVETMDTELDGRALGELMHSALCVTYSALAAAGLLPLRPEGVGVAERQAFEIVDRLLESGRVPGTPAERRLAGWRLKRMARNLFDMEASAAGALTLLETEMWVGGGRGVDVGGVKIQGRIDRVDVTPDQHGLFVLDYKSRSIPSAVSIGTGAGLQLPLYMMALAAERPEAAIIGGAYVSLLHKKRSGVVLQDGEHLLGSVGSTCRVLAEEEMKELFDTARETARQAAAGMREGVIMPRTEGQCPQWCALGPLCRARREGYRP